ncbi:MAG: GNAT family N-acetyltransferase [Pseudomonadota bacterium]
MRVTLSDTPILQTERLTIRAPQAGDEDTLIPFLMSERASWVGGGSDCDLGKAWRIFSIVAGHWVIRGFGTFVYCDRASGRPIGSAGPWYPGNWPEKELGWTVWSPEDEGRGFAFEAVRAVRDHVYGELHWNTAVSYIAHGNKRSRALAERLGCWLDEDALPPYPDEPTWIFRHPGPEGSA